MDFNLAKNSMVFGIAVSLLLHLLVLVSLNLSLPYTVTHPEDRKIAFLLVNVSRPLPAQSAAGGERQNGIPATTQAPAPSAAEPQAKRNARLLILQLQRLLGKQLDVKPMATGQCILLEPGIAAGAKLQCDSSALYEIISGEKMNIINILQNLRSMGRMYNGFVAEKHIDKLHIVLTQDGRVNK